MKVRLLKDEMGPSGPLKAGDIIDHLMAHVLVSLGKAVPVEDEKPAEVQVEEPE